MTWTHDGLWQKTKVYVKRTFDLDRDSPLFPFWAILSLEMLARAALAKVHPVLLADPTGGENILYACGFPSPKAPKSIPAKTVFSRCQKVVADFTEEEFKICMTLVDRRNQELHTGAASFEDFPTTIWLADFFRISELLLRSQGLELSDLFDEDEAKAAQVMIEASRNKARKKASDQIAAAKRTFQALPEQERNNLRGSASAKAKQARRLFGKLISCPACDSEAVITGENVRSTEPRLEEGLIIQETVMIPTLLRCFSCQLELNGHSLLHGAQLGGQYTVRKELDLLNTITLTLLSISIQLTISIQIMAMTELLMYRKGLIKLAATLARNVEHAI
jgi:hypothetical protein